MAVAAPAGATIADEVVVRGGRTLAGTVESRGFKHSLVTIVAATCAAHAELTVGNCPQLAETDALATILGDLGGRISCEGTALTVDARDLMHADLDLGVAERIHGSVYLLPGLLARFGSVALPIAGGCQIGDAAGGGRPFEHYLDVFARFGARVGGNSAGAVTVAADRLTGCDIDLLDYTSDRALRSGPLYSGASKMALLTAAVSHGASHLRNLYPKLDVSDLVQVLTAFGADIEPCGGGSVVVHGRGPEALGRRVEHTLVPDLIELVTWICAGTLLARSPLVVGGPRMESACAALAPEMQALEQMGVQISVGSDRLTVAPAERLDACDLVVTSPGIYSDSQPFFALLATCAGGRSTITETVWSGRFGYADGMRKLGARIGRDGAQIRIDGPSRPHVAGQALAASDLRGAAVLLLAALMVDGETRLEGVHHLARGYEDLIGALRSVGARIH